MVDVGSGVPGMHRALTRHTGFLLARLGLHARKQFGRRLEELGLTTRAWGALNVLANEGPLTQLALGHAVAMDPSSMVGVVDDLEARGFVERRRDPRDRRAYALHVTTAGEEVLARGRRLAQEAQEDLLAPLDPEEREQLHRLLLRLGGVDSVT
jgi:DNA-binding MarR family transcriptional regulator